MPLYVIYYNNEQCLNIFKESTALAEVILTSSKSHDRRSMQPCNDE